MILQVVQLIVHRLLKAMEFLPKSIFNDGVYRGAYTVGGGKGVKTIGSVRFSF